MDVDPSLEVEIPFDKDVETMSSLSLASEYGGNNMSTENSIRTIQTQIERKLARVTIKSLTADNSHPSYQRYVNTQHEIALPQL